MPKGRWAGRMLLAQRVLSVVAAVLVAVVTLIPRRTERQFSVLTEGREVGDELGGILAFVVIGLAGLAVIGVVWRSGLAPRLRMSWPLFVVSVLCLFGLAALASSTVGTAVIGLVPTGMGRWWRQISSALDAEHAVAYAGLAIVVALAWRRKVGLAWLAPALFAFGFALELLQELVPSRKYRWGDLAANGLGIVIGLTVILLFDRLVDLKKSHPGRTRGERRRRSSRSPRRSQGSKRAGLVTALVGLLIALASLLAGSMVEFRLARVGWQILTPFSAAYAMTFWLGVAVMVAGGFLLRRLVGSRRERSRPVRLS